MVQIHFVPLMKYFRIVRTEKREDELWLLLSPDGIEIPNVPVAMIADVKQICLASGTILTIADEPRGLQWRQGLIWAPLSRVTAYEGLPEPTVEDVAKRDVRLTAEQNFKAGCLL